MLIEEVRSGPTKSKSCVTKTLKTQIFSHIHLKIIEILIKKQSDKIFNDNN